VSAHPRLPYRNAEEARALHVADERASLALRVRSLLDEIDVLQAELSRLEEVNLSQAARPKSEARFLITCLAVGAFLVLVGLGCLPRHRSPNDRTRTHSLGPKVAPAARWNENSL